MTTPRTSPFLPVASLLLLSSLAACSRAMTPPIEVSRAPGFGPASGRAIDSLAVAPALPAGEMSEVDEHGLETVTSLVATAASRIPTWRVLGPEEVEETGPEGEDESILSRAGRFAEGAGVDAVLVAEVTRFRERIGRDFGASEPASVALRLMLVEAGANEASWTADYAHTQQPLAYNLWNFWQVARGGVKWLTAAEIARIGIEEALAQLSGHPLDGRAK